MDMRNSLNSSFQTIAQFKKNDPTIGLLVYMMAFNPENEFQIFHVAENIPSH